MTDLTLTGLTAVPGAVIPRYTFADALLLCVAFGLLVISVSCIKVI